MLRFFVWVGILTFALSHAISLTAQTETGTLRAAVTDPSGAFVANATVRLVDVNHGTTTEGITNQSGACSFVNVAPGYYRMEVSKAGFKMVHLTGITVNVQDNLEENFRLDLGSETTSVTVEANAQSLNVTDATVSTVVDRQFVENIPMNGRTFQSLVALVPGVVTAVGASTGSTGEFSVNGQRTEANYYTVDGVAANTGTSISQSVAGANGAVPGVTALGTTQSLVSLDALEEFRVQTSAYSAEYGRVPGGQISFVTRAGVNQWHGSASDYLRNGVLDANNWFNNASSVPKVAERQNDFGGTLGGPIIIPHIYNGKDKTFFFFSYEGLRLASPHAALSTFVPDLALRKAAPAGLQQEINAYPIPNGPENGTTGMAQFVAAYSAPASLNTTAIRMDHFFNGKYKIFGRFSDAPSDSLSRTTVNLANITASEIGVRTLTIGGTMGFSSHLFNELRANYTRNEGHSKYTLDNFGGAVPMAIGDVKDASGNPTPSVDAFLFNLSFGGRGQFTLQDQSQKQWQINLVDTLSYVRGSHSLKFGVDYREITTPLSLYRTEEAGSYTAQAQVISNLTPVLQVLSFNGSPIAPIYKNYSLFVQDEWKVAKRLSLSLGLRWDVNPAPTDKYGDLPYTVDQVTNLATTKLAPKGTPFYKTTFHNFAPRFGLAYQVRAASGWETVIRAGFGLFYDLGTNASSIGYAGQGVQVNQITANLPFPLTAAQLVTPPAVPTYPLSVNNYGFVPGLELPYTLEWNVAIQQSLGKSETLTVNYIGANARRLLQQRATEPGQLGNPNFTATSTLYILQNGPTSNYNALQVQFQRRLSHGLQVLGSYTWAHSIDEASANLISTQLLRGNSAFDVRQNFQAAVTYQIPGSYSSPFLSAVLRHWGLDVREMARTSLPYDITGTNYIDATGQLNAARTNLVPGQPLYISDPNVPGGWRWNFSAFTAATAAQVAQGIYGTAPRNFMRGFGELETDLTVRREFPLKERLKLQFRAEAFNVMNHPVFGAIQTSLLTGINSFGRAIGTLNSQLGGLNALYQQGGPRSLQFSLKLVF